MEILADYPVLQIAAAFIASIIVGVYLMIRGHRTPPNGAGKKSTIHGAAIIDSAVGLELVREVRRLSDAADKIVAILEREATTEQMRGDISRLLAHELAKAKKETGK